MENVFEKYLQQHKKFYTYNENIVQFAPQFNNIKKF